MDPNEEPSKKEDKRGAHWKDKIRSNDYVSPSIHSATWQATVYRMQQQMRQAGLTEAMNSISNTTSATRKAVFMHLMLCEKNGAVKLTRTTDGSGFYGIGRFEITNREVFDSCPDKIGEIHTVRWAEEQTRNVRKKTIKKHWSDLGMRESVDDASGHLVYKFDPERFKKHEAFLAKEKGKKNVYKTAILPSSTVAGAAKPGEGEGGCAPSEPVAASVASSSAVLQPSAPASPPPSVVQRSPPAVDSSSSATPQLSAAASSTSTVQQIPAAASPPPPLAAPQLPAAASPPPPSVAPQLPAAASPPPPSVARSTTAKVARVRTLMQLHVPATTAPSSLAMHPYHRMPVPYFNGPPLTHAAGQSVQRMPGPAFALGPPPPPAAPAFTPTDREQVHFVSATDGLSVLAMVADKEFERQEALRRTGKQKAQAQAVEPEKKKAHQTGKRKAQAQEGGPKKKTARQPQEEEKEQCRRAGTVARMRAALDKLLQKERECTRRAKGEKGAGRNKLREEAASYQERAEVLRAKIARMD